MRWSAQGKGPGTITVSLPQFYRKDLVSTLSLSLFRTISIMLLQPKTKDAFDSFTLKGIIIPHAEKPEHSFQKENLQKGPQKEATVLGIIQILCCLMISSMGAILVSTPYSPHFKPAVSTILMSEYPFLGALCFAITGSLSIISGKKSTKPFAMSSLIANAVSFVVAGVGLFLLADSLVALWTASQRCGSEKDSLSSLPYSGYYYSTYEIKGCLLASVSLIGVLVVMFIFTVLELLQAAFASVLWWKQIYSNNPGVSTLKCHMIPAGSQDLSDDKAGLKSGRKRSQ
ncbi:hypothetical protein MC885_000850 [Smutsia gigantea]|nr:hypothetical protein MC885_000850 [Smutsia gigantea]